MSSAPFVSSVQISQVCRCSRLGRFPSTLCMIHFPIWRWAQTTTSGVILIVYLSVWQASSGILMSIAVYGSIGWFTHLLFDSSWCFLVSFFQFVRVDTAYCSAKAPHECNLYAHAGLPSCGD
ncbi:hypothetical protein DFJ77DRAFT_34170 [Powellomyces hirtus]|nr:hypothetical protein DFJ77DRAFT_34170 [Powellomyces hirtus]